MCIYNAGTRFNVSVVNSPPSNSYTTIPWFLKMQLRTVSNLQHPNYLLLRTHKASFEFQRYNANDSDLSVVWFTAVLLHTRLYACVYVCVPCIRIMYAYKYAYNSKRSRRKRRQNEGRTLETQLWWWWLHGLGALGCMIIAQEQRGHVVSLQSWHLHRFCSWTSSLSRVSQLRPLLNTSLWNCSRDPLVNARMHSVHRYILNALSGASQPFLPLFLSLHLPSFTRCIHQGTTLCFD